MAIKNTSLKGLLTYDVIIMCFSDESPYANLYEKLIEKERRTIGEAIRKNTGKYTDR